MQFQSCSLVRRLVCVRNPILWPACVVSTTGGLEWHNILCDSFYYNQDIVGENKIFWIILPLLSHPPFPLAVSSSSVTSSTLAQIYMKPPCLILLLPTREISSTHFIFKKTYLVIQFTCAQTRVCARAHSNRRTRT